jgi:hypothetical protein
MTTEGGTPPLTTIGLRADITRSGVGVRADGGDFNNAIVKMRRSDEMPGEVKDTEDESYWEAFEKAKKRP